MSKFKDRRRTWRIQYWRFVGKSSLKISSYPYTWTVVIVDFFWKCFICSNVLFPLQLSICSTLLLLFRFNIIYLQMNIHVQSKWLKAGQYKSSTITIVTWSCRENMYQKLIPQLLSTSLFMRYLFNYFSLKRVILYIVRFFMTGSLP